LGNDEALLIKAKENFKDGDKEIPSGEKWTVKGPCRYIPDIKVEVIERRRKICLDKNEGIYVRDTRKGDVKLISGTTYLLKSHEELWSMNLNRDVDRLLTKANGV
jgi:major vault protein